MPSKGVVKDGLVTLAIFPVPEVDTYSTAVIPALTCNICRAEPIARRAEVLAPVPCTKSPAASKIVSVDTLPLVLPTKSIMVCIVTFLRLFESLKSPIKTVSPKAATTKVLSLIIEEISMSRAKELIKSAN